MNEHDLDENCLNEREGLLKRIDEVAIGLSVCSFF